MGGGGGVIFTKINGKPGTTNRNTLDALMSLCLLFATNA